MDLRHLRFTPQEADHWDVRIHWVDPLLAVLPACEPIVATGHPNLDMSEIGQPGQINGDQFFGFPDRHSSHSSWLHDVTELVMAGKVAILPELCVDASGLSHLIRLWEQRSSGERPFVFIPGSVHREVDGVRVNRSQIHVRGLAEPIIVDKQVPFKMIEAGEAILRKVPPALDVYVIGGWRLAGLICRDALRPEISALLARLGVTLLLMPTMSPSLALFATLNQVAATNWGIVVAANNPAHWPAAGRHGSRNPAQVQVCWPFEDPTGLSISTGAGESAIRGAWLLDAKSGSIASTALPD